MSTSDEPPHFSPCYFCAFHSVEPGRSAQTCPFCDGVGLEYIKTGVIPIKTTCRVCKGSGVYIYHKCNNCHGFGQVMGKRRILIPVPPSTQDMQSMRVELEGEELFVTFRVEKSSYFRVEGNDIHTDAVISLSQAVLGGSAKIEGLTRVVLQFTF